MYAEWLTTCARQPWISWVWSARCGKRPAFSSQRWPLVADEPLVSIVVGGELPDLPAAVEVAAYRIASEGVTNSVRHGMCRRCVVTLRSDDGCLVVEIRDDGTGIDGMAVPHVGLLTMRERAEELGGRVTIESSGNGTRVLASLPLKGDQ